MGQRLLVHHARPIYRRGVVLTAPKRRLAEGNDGLDVDVLRRNIVNRAILLYLAVLTTSFEYHLLLDWDLFDSRRRSSLMVDRLAVLRLTRLCLLALWPGLDLGVVLNRLLLHPADFIV